MTARRPSIRLDAATEAQFTKLDALNEALRAHMGEWDAQFAPEDLAAWERLCGVLQSACTDPTIAKSPAVAGFAGYLVEALGDRLHELVHGDAVAVLAEVAAESRRRTAASGADAANARTDRLKSKALAYVLEHRAKYTNYQAAADDCAARFPGLNADAYRTHLEARAPGLYSSRPGRPKKT